MSKDTSAIQLLYGIFTSLPEEAYIVHVEFPTNSPEEPLVHFQKVHQRLNQLGIKLLLVLEKDYNYLGVAFRGSEAIHQTIVESLIESGFGVQSNRYTDVVAMRADLVTALEAAVKQRQLAGPAEVAKTLEYLKRLRRSK